MTASSCIDKGRLVLPQVNTAQNVCWSFWGMECLGLWAEYGSLNITEGLLPKADETSVLSDHGKPWGSYLGSQQASLCHFQSLTRVKFILLRTQCCLMPGSFVCLAIAAKASAVFAVLCAKFRSQASLSQS